MGNDAPHKGINCLINHSGAEGETLIAAGANAFKRGKVAVVLAQTHTVCVGVLPSVLIKISEGYQIISYASRRSTEGNSHLNVNSNPEGVHERNC